MILSDAVDIETHTESGVWGHLALDEMFLFAARKGSSRTALIDPANRDTICPGQVRRMTFSEVADALETLAARFVAADLQPDDMVVVQLPNTVEAYIVLLALFRARLIACPVPTLWREHELKTALEPLLPRALITMTDIDGHAHAQMMSYVAGELISVRNVFAFGDGMPDGVEPLDGIFDPDSRQAADTLPPHRDEAANHVATVMFEALGDTAPRAIARSHNQWIAAALQHVAVPRLSRNDIVLSPWLPTSLPGFSAIFVPWLLTGATLALHHPFDQDMFTRALGETGATYTLLPASVLDAVAADGFAFDKAALTRVGCVWADPSRAKADEPPRAGGLPVNDVYQFGELASITRDRGEDAPGRIPLGRITVSSEDHLGLVVLEARVRGRIQKAGDTSAALSGMLQVRGPMLPALDYGSPDPRIAKAEEGEIRPYVETGVQALVCQGNPPAADCTAAVEGVMHLGNAALSMIELDRLIAGHSGVSDAAVFPVPDPVLGSRLEAAVVPRHETRVSSEDMQAYLRARRVAEHKIPLRTVAVEEIPRTLTGEIDRERLAGKV